MHEFSVARSLFKQVNDLAGPRPVKTVTLVIGQYSGVEVSLLETAFDTLKKDLLTSEARLVIERRDFQLHCNSCNETWSPPAFTVQCPGCECFDTDIISGRELLLKEIEFIEAEDDHKD